MLPEFGFGSRALTSVEETEVSIGPIMGKASRDMTSIELGLILFAIGLLGSKYCPEIGLVALSLRRFERKPRHSSGYSLILLMEKGPSLMRTGPGPLLGTFGNGQS